MDRRSRSPQRPRRRRDYSDSPSSSRRRIYTSSRSPPRRRSREYAPRRRHSSSVSPPRQRYRSRSPAGRRLRKSLPPQKDVYGSHHNDERSEAVTKPPPKEKPNFKNTGLLAAETNKVTVGDGKQSQDIILKYHEPPEARKPPSSEPWAAYVFKGDSKNPMFTIPLHTRSCWLLGREEAVADIPLEHPSCSKQHAVFQFKHKTKMNEFGEKKTMIGLYVLDLDSSNGTLLNGDKVSAARYVQCVSGDVVKFGDSSREYVILLPPKGE